MASVSKPTRYPLPSVYTILLLNKNGSRVFRTHMISLLPLNIVSFSATAHDKMASVLWQTSNEVNATYYTVQRSTNGLHFINAGKVAAVNASGNHSYQFSDDLFSLSGVTKVYYRLQTTDKDGRSTMSSILSISLTDNKLITIQPNPARSYAVINCNTTGRKTITITDMNGRKVLVKTTANNSEKVAVSSFAKGIYIVRIDYAGGSDTRKLVVE